MSEQNERITIITSKKKRFHLGIKEALHYKDLIFLFVSKSFKAQYKQMLLGPVWALIQPLLTTVVFTVVFGRIAGLPTDGAPQFLFYMCGNVLWGYFSACLNGSANIFSSNAYLFSKVYFPRLVSPIANVLNNMLNAGIQVLIFFAFLVFYIAKGSVSPNYAMIPLSLLLVLEVTALGMGLGLILAAATVKYRDLKMLISFGLQLWLYASPIAYSVELVKDKAPDLINLFMLNPIAPIVQGMRKIFLGTGEISVKYLLISVAVSVVIMLLGMMVFNRTEKTFADNI